jgi:hypothetical protein
MTLLSEIVFDVESILEQDQNLNQDIYSLDQDQDNHLNNWICSNNNLFFLMNHDIYVIPLPIMSGYPNTNNGNSNNDNSNDIKIVMQCHIVDEPNFFETDNGRKFGIVQYISPYNTFNDKAQWELMVVADNRLYKFTSGYIGSDHSGIIKEISLSSIPGDILANRSIDRSIHGNIIYKINNVYNSYNDFSRFGIIINGRCFTQGWNPCLLGHLNSTDIIHPGFQVLKEVSYSKDIIKRKYYRDVIFGQYYTCFVYQKISNNMNNDNSNRTIIDNQKIYLDLIIITNTKCRVYEYSIVNFNGIVSGNGDLYFIGQ